MTFRVALGVQGAQTHTSAGRGLGRYVADQAGAMVEHRPERLFQLSYDPELPFPAQLSGPVPLMPSADPPEPGAPLVFHVLSPFELLALDRVWPPWAQATEAALVVTLHDLIPLIFSDVYLEDPHLRKWYLPRLELVRGADAVVAISESAGADAERLLGVRRERIFVSGEDAGPLFRPAAVEREGFVLAVGGLDVRKNIPRLVEAYAGLPGDLRARHRLVLAGTWLPAERRELERLVRRNGVAADTDLAGRLADAELAAMYQRCALYVMPSVYEGFGLPVLEAMRCGAAVIAADSSSLRELVTPPDARFDPLSTTALRERISRALTDAAFGERLRQAAADSASRYSWSRACDVVAQAHEYAAGRRARFRSRS